MSRTASTTAPDSRVPAVPDTGTRPLNSLDPGHPEPRLTTRWWGLVVRFAVAAALLQAANSIRYYGLSPILDRLEPASTAHIVLGVVGHAVTFALVLAGLWAWMRWVERRPLRTAGWNLRPSLLGWTGLGVLASLVVVVVAVVVGDLVLAPAADAATGPTGDLGTVPIGLLLLHLVSLAFLLQGIPEELLYRGWLWSTTQQRPVLTLVWTSLAFTVIHLTSHGGQRNLMEHLVYLTIPLGFGVLAGVLVLLTGSMWAAAGVHGGFHVAVNLAFAVAPGQAGPGMWVILCLTYLGFAALLLALWQWRRTRTA